MMLIKYCEERLQILAAGDVGSRAVLCPANYLQEFEAKLARFLWKIQRKVQEKRWRGFGQEGLSYKKDLADELSSF